MFWVLNHTCSQEHMTKLKRLCVGMSVFTEILDKELTNIAASNISSEFSLRCTYLKQFNH